MLENKNKQVYEGHNTRGRYFKMCDFPSNMAMLKECETKECLKN